MVTGEVDILIFSKIPLISDDELNLGYQIKRFKTRQNL